MDRDDEEFLRRVAEAFDLRGQLEREIECADLATKTLRALSGPPGSDAPLIVYEDEGNG